MRYHVELELRDGMLIIRVPVALVPRLVVPRNGHRPPGLDLNLLSRREQEVLARVLAGDSNKEVAAALGITERTAKFHVSKIISIFGLHRSDLLRLYGTNGKEDTHVHH